MKKEEKSIRYKGILALLLIILIFIAVRFALLYIGARIGETRENELIQLKMSALTDIVSDANARRAAAAEHVSEHVTADTQLMTDMLKEFCTDDIYDGPRVFSGGFVAELCQDRVLLPPETEVYAEFLTPSRPAKLRPALRQRTLMQPGCAFSPSGRLRRTWCM